MKNLNKLNPYYKMINSILATINSSIILKCLGVLVAFYSPIGGVLLCVGLFILADTLTGIWKSVKTGTRSSKKMRQGLVPKMLLYQSAILLLFVLDFYILGGIVSIFFKIPYLVTKLGALVLIYIELTSIDENWTIIKGKSLWSSTLEMFKKLKTVKSNVDSITESPKTPEDMTI